MAHNIAQKTLTDLEFSTVLETIREFCISDLGREAVKNLSPIRRSLELKSELNQVNEYLSSFENENRIPSHYFEEITKEISLLAIEDSFLEGPSFMKIAGISENINNLLLFFKKFKDYYPTLFAQSEEIELNKEMVKRITKIISPFGEVKDKASPELQRIRKEMNKIRGQLGGSFNKALAHYASQGYLDDIRESVIDSQRVLAVQAMFRRKVKGAIMGSSKTGSIVYIAPEATLQLSRELQNITYEEQEEIVKILKELTNTMRPYSPLLKKYQKYLTHLDSLGSRAKYAQKIKACLPKIVNEKKINLINAYHPILWLENQKKGLPTIPQNLELNEKQQIIVISGPNAGGKSITLKTIGLLQVMLQSGILVPVHERSEVSIFDKVLSDIGDNQSIENQLSTYSYRLKNMRNFLKKCNDNTLFLIDEFGTGSDPELGGALAEVFLEEFYEKGAFGVITTHYSNLKVLASELPNVTNANMQFDQSSLEPLFKLHTGQAGSSFTFEVAQKNGIPFRLINRAKKKVEREKIRLDKTIAKLQKERNELQKNSDRLLKEQDLAKSGAEKLLIQQQKIKEKIEGFQELYDNNQKMLSYGRKTNEVFNKFFQTKNKKELRDAFVKWSLIEQSKYDERKNEKIKAELNKKNDERQKPLSKRERTKINKALKEKQRQKEAELKKIEKEVLPEVQKVRDQKEKVEREKAIYIKDYRFQLNDTVRLKDGNAKGTIEKIEKNTAIINYGLFTAKTDLSQLELVKKAGK
ncbi:endonuclease MutS2 [Lutimonas zeaxanthinifaciens]|uniref:endonuclease MutS2 n=1 Tax=Lutimonas zeaxanthinifaciens TaxID=3060215 RepID=UPI00265CB872|nr:DNA mismatch repair protein MutS [Lutimonas sp. YSD2104]WKK65185.1 DNA mismatch repair protein MutS [Lutimonas sp. YSD2104]